MKKGRPIITKKEPRFKPLAIDWLDAATKRSEEAQQKAKRKRNAADANPKSEEAKSD